MKFLHFWFILLWMFLFATPIQAYWSNAHKKFAEAAAKGNVRLSAIENSESLEKYYTHRLGFSLSKIYTFNDIEKINPLPNNPQMNGSMIRIVPDVQKTGSEILIEGADDEDYPFVRAINHFFDPANNHSLGQSLQLRNQYWYQFDDALTGLIVAANQSNKTPDWALEDNAEIPGSDRQQYSLRDSNEHLYQALTTTDTTRRNKAMGAHLYALGHVIHLLTDMGQPEHVRNDVHLASLYEKHTDEQVTSRRIDFLNLFYNGSINYNVNREQFKKTRDYFVTTGNGTGIGLAEFSNRNFVSPTTNFNSGDSIPISYWWTKLMCN